MKLDFRLWYEDDRLIKQDVQSRANESAVDNFVKRSSQLEYCTLLVNKFLKQGRGIIEEVHEAPISGNLLSVQNDRLGRAVTIYDSVNRARFKFFPAGREAGNIWLRFPPVIFTNNDRVMLKGIVIHELQHADDWVATGFQMQEVESSEFDMDRYLGMVEEARGLYVQLRYLLKRIGNVDEIVKLLSGNQPGGSPFAMREELIPAAKAFLDHFKSLGEGLGSFAMAPMLAAGSPEISQNNPNLDRPAIVYNMQQEQARNAASAVKRLVQMFSFSQYVAQTGKKF